ncbi:MAG: winged helix-turn-helix domain-containing protein [Candidatus Omnitrophica bacterium]|nr:winged helix-turn-helix domain-containing protein [Candidatus Omnitrophota bacterium]
MIIEIGIVAGEIWHYLDNNGETILPNLINDIGKDRNVTLMSLGWLAREGHIILSQRQGKDDYYRVQLRK